MEDAFFKLGIPSYPSNGVSDIKDDPEFEDLAQNYFTPKYDFNFATGNTPDIVFIFLGTNDLTLDDPMPMCDAFVESYMQFVSKILDIYGKNTKICIMQGLTGGRGEPISLDSARISSILRAAKALMHEYPDNVCYIDHETVASWGTEISEDKTHPSPKGYDTLTHEVAKYLAEHFDTRA